MKSFFFAGGRSPKHNHRGGGGKSKKNGGCGIRDGMNDDQLGAVPKDVVAVRSGEPRLDAKFPEGSGISVDAER